MKGYVFNYGLNVDAGTVPAHSVGCYLDYNKALEKCKKLNQREYNSSPWINQDYSLEDMCLRDEPFIGFYSIEEIEIFF